MSAGRAATVVGGGVVGLVLSLRLADEGWRVTLVGSPDGSASAAAAGMLAPASESLLDAASPAQASALSAAGTLWDGLSDRLHVALDRAGARHFGEREALVRSAEAAQRLDFRARLEDAGEGRAPSLSLDDDAALDPPAALAALERALASAGVARVAGQVAASRGRLELAGASLEGDVVIAAGWGSRALAAAAPELAALRPIKGQLLHFPGAAPSGPSLRTPAVYLVPQPGGWIAGATMEPGRSDLAPDPRALRRLRAAAAELRPELASAPAEARVGVRAEAPDGLPLVGRSRSGAWLATGLRRNGWLLAPLVAEGIAAYLGGRDPDASLAGQALAWSPARIVPPQGAA